MRRTLRIAILLAALFVVTMDANVYAAPIFEYELWMQSKTSLDQGHVEIMGKIVNKGTATLDLGNSSAGWGPWPGDLVVPPVYEYPTNRVPEHLLLVPGETFDFLWFSATIIKDESMWAGLLFQGAFNFVPYGSGWKWTTGGCLPGIIVTSEWVIGPVGELTWNVTTINLDTAGKYMKITPFEPVPEPATMLLLSLGLAGVVFARGKFQK